MHRVGKVFNRDDLTLNARSGIVSTSAGARRDVSEPPLTRRQAEVLDFVARFSAERGMPPTVREIGQALGMASPNAVADHLAVLERKGYLSREPGKSRAIRPTRAVPRVPIVGSIAAGKPIPAIEEVQGFLSPFPADDGSFVLRVRGDSMTGDGILPGDLLVVRRQQTADRGQIVAVLIDDDATVKRFQPEADLVVFAASNPAHPPIVVLPGDDRRVEILGVVTGVVRRL
jgi:repressor LexA